MKKIEVNRYIKKYIEPNMPDYLVYKDLIYKVDDEFFLKKYTIVSRGNDEDDLWISVSIQPLYVKVDFLYKTFGFNLFHKKRLSLIRSEKTELWDARKQQLDNSFQSIFESIITQGEPFLKSIDSPEHFFKKFKKDAKEDISSYEGIAYSTILFGDEKFQEKNLTGLIDFCDKQISGEYDEIELQIKADATLLLNAGTTEQRLKILKTWANETIGHLKLPNVGPFEL